MTSNNKQDNPTENHTPAQRETSDCSEKGKTDSNENPGPNWKFELAALVSGAAIIGLIIFAVWIIPDNSAIAKALTSTIPAVAALTGTMIITRRWYQNYQQNAQRMADENTRHREQVRNNRQENFGDRLAAAINHLSGTTAVEQVAGLTELAGIAEDWWNLGQEMKNDLPDTEEQHLQRQQIDDMVNRRRQEIIDLMFKTPLATLEQDSDEEQQRDKQVQQRRSSILRNNIPDATTLGSTKAILNPTKTHRAGPASTLTTQT